MNEPEQTKSILETIRRDLKREKEEVVAILKDPKVAEWQSVDLAKNQALLTHIGVAPAVIGTAIIDYQKQARMIGKQIVDWDNEVGNQLADLIAHPEPKTALPAAQKLEAKSRGITAMKEELMVRTRRLVRADQVLRQQLSLKPMLAIAKIMTTGRKDLFDGGLLTLELFINDIGQKDGFRTIADMVQEPAKLEARFQRLDITKLPRIVEEILFNYIEEAVYGAKEIGIFLGAVTDRVAREVSSVTTIEQNLNTLLEENTAGLLKGIAEQATLLGNIIVALYHKRQVSESLATVTEALDYLNIFHLLLKRNLVASLQKEVEMPGSTLNPATSSFQMTRTFFMGAKGVIRSIKMMMTSLTGKEAINETELQQTLEKGIVNCKHFLGKAPDDLDKIKLYIDSLIGHYPKPFPYNDLFKLAKSTLASYGEGVESYIHTYDIPRDMQALATGNIPTKAGNLLAAIAKYKISFRKANIDQGNAPKTTTAS